MEKLYYTAKEVAEMLDVSVSHAYKVIREANRELSSKGFYVRAGRVSRKYLDSKVYDLCDKTAYERREIEARIKASGMMKKTFFTRCCIYGRICVVGKKETVYMLVQKLEKMQAVIHKMYDEIIQTGQIKEKESPVDGGIYTDIEELQHDYLAMIKAVVDMLDGAKYLWQK